MNHLRKVSVPVQVGVTVSLLTMAISLAADAPVRSLVP
jgi:hypothetical protein